MLKLVEINGHEVYFNPSFVQSFDPVEGEVVLADGKVLIIDTVRSDVHLLIEGFHMNDKAELDYLRQVLENVEVIVNGDSDKPVLTAYGPMVPDTTVERASFVIDELVKKYSDKTKKDESDKV